MNYKFLVFLLALLMCGACGEDGDNNGEDASADTGTESDTDTNTDTTVGDGTDGDTDTGSHDLQVDAGGYVVFGPWQGYAWVNDPQLGTVAPANFDALEAGDRLCISGETAADYFSTPWLAVNLNEAKDEKGSAGTVSPTDEGLFVNVDNIAGSPLRVQLTDAAGNHWCHLLGVEGGITLPFGDFNTTCWDGKGEWYDNEPIVSVDILVPGTIDGEFEFEFCLDELHPTAAALVCDDVPVPGDAYTCADQAGWGKCDEAWMQGYCLFSCGKCDEAEIDTDTVPIDSEIDTAVDTDPDNHPGFYVSGRHLYDRCDEQVLLRGVNKMIVWNDDAGDSLPEIEQTGANVVRIVWITTGAVAKLDAVIQRTLDNDMIPMIELHDATGSWNKGDLKDVNGQDILGLSDLVDWWVTPDVVDVIEKYEQDLLINIGNEVGQGVKLQTYVKGYMDAITRMREAGIKTTLIIDASGYGQDIDRLQEAGPTLFNHDPYSNVLFSVHMWWPDTYHSTAVWATPADKVVGEIAESVDMGLPLIVGEFAHTGVGCNGVIPYLKIIEECQSNDIGWLAWSWGPGNADCAEMDITDDNTYAGIQEGWGKEVMLTDTNSVANTSVRPASIVNGTCE